MENDERALSRRPGCRKRTEEVKHSSTTAWGRLAVKKQVSRPWASASTAVLDAKLLSKPSPSGTSSAWQFKYKGSYKSKVTGYERRTAGMSPAFLKEHLLKNKQEVGREKDMGLTQDIAVLETPLLSKLVFDGNLT